MGVWHNHPHNMRELHGVTIATADHGFKSIKQQVLFFDKLHVIGLPTFLLNASDPDVPDFESLSSDLMFLLSKGVVLEVDFAVVFGGLGDIASVPTHGKDSCWIVTQPPWQRQPSPLGAEARR